MKFSLPLLLLTYLAMGICSHAQEDAPGNAAISRSQGQPKPVEEPAGSKPETKTVAENDILSPTTPVSESPPSGDAAAFTVPEEMAVFQGHAGNWKGMTKTAITEKGKKTLTQTRSEWTGGYLMGGHLFEMRGYSYGDLGRTQYRWQYTYDALKERYMGAYHDSHGRTHFCEGKINQDKTKIIWRLLAPPGDMKWHAETDLHPEDGIETNGQITSEKFNYDMVYSSVFRRS